jgi:hypothetical protein
LENDGAAFCICSFRTLFFTSGRHARAGWRTDSHNGDYSMTNYVWVVEIKKNREYVPFSTRKTQAAAKLVKTNNERLYPEKFRVKRYLREKK